VLPFPLGKFRQLCDLSFLASWLSMLFRKVQKRLRSIRAQSNRLAQPKPNGPL
ncbi:unnamed protein product, partial [Onchocerca ochengi]